MALTSLSSTSVVISRTQFHTSRYHAWVLFVGVQVGQCVTHGGCAEHIHGGKDTRRKERNGELVHPVQKQA